VVAGSTESSLVSSPFASSAPKLPSRRRNHSPAHGSSFTLTSRGVFAGTNNGKRLHGARDSDEERVIRRGAPRDVSVYLQRQDRIFFWVRHDGSGHFVSEKAVGGPSRFPNGCTEHETPTRKG
jgi:hypothetical protein